MIALIKISGDVILSSFFDILIYFPSRRPATIVRRPLRRDFNADLHSRLMEAKKTTEITRRRRSEEEEEEEEEENDPLFPLQDVILT